MIYLFEMPIFAMLTDQRVHHWSLFMNRFKTPETCYFEGGFVLGFCDLLDWFQGPFSSYIHYINPITTQLY